MMVAVIVAVMVAFIVVQPLAYFFVFSSKR